MELDNKIIEKYRPEWFNGGRDYEELNLTIEDVKNAIENETVLEALAGECDEELNLTVRLSETLTGYIPFSEIQFKVRGDKYVKHAEVYQNRDKHIKFVIKSIEEEDGNYKIQCSRKRAQEMCYNAVISKFRPGDIIDVRVNMIADFGIFCDVGCGITALMPVANICTSKIIDLKEKLLGIKKMKAVVKKVNEDKIELTHKELLGTWEENLEVFMTRSTGEFDRDVKGKIVNITDEEMFIRVAPNLVCIAVNNDDRLKIGDWVLVRLKDLDRDLGKAKVKIVRVFRNHIEDIEKFSYKVKGNHIDSWVYSPNSSIRTDFN